MIVIAQALAYLLLGVVMSLVHMAMLRASMQKALCLPPEKARARIVRGLPLRILLWAPAFLLAARLGGLAVGFLVAGSVIGRWVVCALLGLGLVGDGGGKGLGPTT